jgi:hypothetical protein
MGTQLFFGKEMGTQIFFGPFNSLLRVTCLPRRAARMHYDCEIAVACARAGVNKTCRGPACVIEWLEGPRAALSGPIATDHLELKTRHL